jgi:antitoxin CcdA
MGKAELKIEIDADLLKQAKAAHLSISHVVEKALQAQLQSTGMNDRARAWADENAEAIKDHQERIAQYGVFGDDLRTW